MNTDLRESLQREFPSGIPSREGRPHSLQFRRHRRPLQPGGAGRFSKTTEDVSRLVRFASERSVPIVTRGSGSGLSGGSPPIPGGLIVCLSRMDRILEVDTKNLCLRAEAGASPPRSPRLRMRRSLLPSRSRLHAHLHHRLAMSLRTAADYAD